jgi:hypothetical protein
MLRQRKKVAADSMIASSPGPPVGSESVSQPEIAALAHRLWQSRGCPEGSPDEDWFRAELELGSKPHEGIRNGTS